MQAQILRPIFNCQRSVGPRAAPPVAQPELFPAQLDFPDSKDLRESWWDVGFQEMTGSCVGWAVADSVLRWHFVKAGKISSNEHLSVRYVWMAAKETDIFTAQPTTFIESAFTKIEAGLKVVKVFGIVKEDILPFKPRCQSNSDTFLFKGDDNEFYSLASELAITNYVNLRPDMEHLIDVNLLCRWLAHIGPIIVRMGADKALVDASKETSSLAEYNAFESNEGHAAALAGYYKNQERLWFILRNSWGTSWGDYGYAYLSEQYVRMAINEAWGIII